MGLFDDIATTIDAGARAGGQWLGDELGAAPSASAPHSADAEAHTAQPTPPEGRSLVDGFVHGLGELGRGVQQEGLGAVFDPFGAVDRQEAQEDLAGRFNVVPAGAAGAGINNTVTEEEFQRIARQYSDIRMGRGNLDLNTDGMSEEDAQTFRQRTMEDIGDILQTNEGRELVGELQEGALETDGEHHRRTRIGQAADVDSSAGGGRWNADSTEKTGFANYVPGENALPSWLSARSDVTLFHELAHARASTYETWDHGTVGSDAAAPQDVGESESEYQAAGLGDHASDELTENSYRRARQEIGRSGSGMRTLGGSDEDMAERAYYNRPPP